MRAVFSVICAAGVLALVVSATPLSREKRFAGVFSSVGFPFGAGGMAFAGPSFNPYVTSRSNPYATNRNPYDVFGQDGFFNLMPMPVVMPVPFPSIKFPVLKNWYEGENVCKEEKILNTQLPDAVIPDDWKDDLPNVDTDFSHEQESCKGTDKKYICTKRIMGNNGEAQVRATKYECCHGFVRDPTGEPGCIESKQTNPTGAPQGTEGKLTPNDPTYYIFSGTGGRSSSASRSSSGNVDKVPIQ